MIAGAAEFKALNDLPAVPIELDVIAQTLQSDDVLLNEAFTFDNFLKQQITQSPNILHLATHAEFNAGNLDESFIQFWDSPITFEQMKDMPWQELELLILSACNTAVGSPEAELGFLGLAAAAGIETSIGSLWNVSDIGTLTLMAEFYTQLPNAALRADVIQQAQIALLQGETHIIDNTLQTSQGDIALPAEWNLETASFTHPFYWAGFTMVGIPWR
ncbi:MAG: CHAT domain-containing protein [Cyanobacteria bacterium P01_C01_bin.118]